MSFVNNHIHTVYSFSPYTPRAAAFAAKEAGLASAGIMDHDSMAGAKEFILACAEAGIASTVGFECRVSMAGTPFEKFRLNNPDQDGIAYVTVHGVPHGQIDRVEAWLAPYRARRNERNLRMTARLDACLSAFGMSVDFKREVLPLSKADRGGSVTERHLLFAAALKMLSAFPRGSELPSFLSEKLGISLSEKQRLFLEDESNAYRSYDLLGVLKSSLIRQIYLPAQEECPAVAELVGFAEEIGAISAYAYLGDVGESPTGDKKAQKFEDAYLDELVPFLKQLGFRALAYMPSRNTGVQLQRVMTLCRQYGLFEISGEDINSPRQSFICPQLSKPEFAHLTQATWALIGHERLATEDPSRGMFSAETCRRFPSLSERIAYFAKAGLR